MDIPVEELLVDNTLNFATGYLTGNVLGYGFESVGLTVDWKEGLVSGVTGAAGGDYISVNYSGGNTMDAISDDPGFVSGVVMGVYAGKKFAQKDPETNKSIEEVYNETELDMEELLEM
jgi:hypothetical protein